MTFRLPATPPTPPGGDRSPAASSDGDADDDDLGFADWGSDGPRATAVSLFDGTVHVDAAACIKHDAATHEFDLGAVTARLGLDFHQRVRLVNYIRSQKIAPGALKSLAGTEPLLADDAYLKPALEDDALLQMPSDDWSDSDAEAGPEPPARTIARLRERLIAAKQDLADYKRLVSARLDVAGLFADEPDAAPAAPLPRDDDTHYFRSYAEHDIHAVMINDRVRTATYASFILSNPALFRGATVLDVGCGTGILSLFAARAGAKRVFAVDASDIAQKAARIVKDNQLEDIITVIQGKVEDVMLPDGVEKVDIIVSEWMGYALVYESMLDSVLAARDRFLAPHGVLAPAQCRMMLALADATEVYKERIDFWTDVYGFNMGVMQEDQYADALVDVIPPESLVTPAQCIQDMHLHTMASRDADFSAPFALTASRNTRAAHAFVLYFDAFFAPTRAPVPDDTPVHCVREGEVLVAEVWQVGHSGGPTPRVGRGLERRRSSFEAQGRPASFSTGPHSVPTHWKQTLFVLRTPLALQAGAVVEGTFYCRKSVDNARELDVEIHYAARFVDSDDEDATGKHTEHIEHTVQMFKVR